MSVCMYGVHTYIHMFSIEWYDVAVETSRHPDMEWFPFRCIQRGSKQNIVGRASHCAYISCIIQCRWPWTRLTGHSRVVWRLVFLTHSPQHRMVVQMRHMRWWWCRRTKHQTHITKHLYIYTLHTYTESRITMILAVKYNKWSEWTWACLATLRSLTPANTVTAAIAVAFVWCATYTHTQSLIQSQLIAKMFTFTILV